MNADAILTAALAMPAAQRAALANRLVLSIEDEHCAHQMLCLATNARNAANRLTKSAFERDAG